jgi:hypothetical protein
VLAVEDSVDKQASSSLLIAKPFFDFRSVGRAPGKQRHLGDKFNVLRFLITGDAFADKLDQVFRGKRLACFEFADRLMAEVSVWPYMT